MYFNVWAFEETEKRVVIASLKKVYSRSYYHLRVKFIDWEVISGKQILNAPINKHLSGI